MTWDLAVTRALYCRYNEIMFLAFCTVLIALYDL